MKTRTASSGLRPASASVVSTLRLIPSRPNPSRFGNLLISSAIVLGVLLSVTTARAQTWMSTGSMATPRAGATAILLPTGKVLMVGGGNYGPPVASAELYDPTTGTFAPTGSMSVGRTNEYMGEFGTLLPNGKAILIGGFDGSSTRPSAEIYDPTTGQFSLTGSMSTGRLDFAIVRLGNGKVMAAGGFTVPGYQFLSSAEIYDPTSGTFSTTGSMSIARTNFTLTLLPSGKVLVAGGFGGISSTEIYDPTTGAFSPSGSMSTSRAYHRAVLLPSGKVLVLGGAAGSSAETPLATAELYDPATGTFTLTGSMTTTRASAFTATLLPSGKVLVAGGINGGGSSAELYDPATGAFSAIANMSSSRTIHTATLLPAGDVLVAGGQDTPSTISASAEIFSSRPDTTAPVLALPADQVVEATSAAGAVAMFAATATDNVGVVSITYTQNSGTVFPIGVTTVRVTAADAAGNTSSGTFTITVRDTTPPVITNVNPSVTSLWPANHKMVAISVSAMATDAVGVSSLRIISVASNELDNGLGDGDTPNDVQITGSLTLSLRAERSGSGNGRVYTITVRATDAAGNHSDAQTMVTVPHDQH